MHAVRVLGVLWCFFCAFGRLRAVFFFCVFHDFCFLAGFGLLCWVLLFGWFCLGLFCCRMFGGWVVWVGAGL